MTSTITWNVHAEEVLFRSGKYSYVPSCAAAACGAAVLEWHVNAQAKYSLLVKETCTEVTSAIQYVTLPGVLRAVIAGQLAKKEIQGPSRYCAKTSNLIIVHCRMLVLLMNSSSRKPVHHEDSRGVVAGCRSLAHVYITSHDICKGYQRCDSQLL